MQDKLKEDQCLYNPQVDVKRHKGLRIASSSVVKINYQFHALCMTRDLET